MQGYRHKELRTLETPHTRRLRSCCLDGGSCGRCPRRRPPLSRPGCEGSSAHCWVWSANCVPDPSPPSIRSRDTLNICKRLVWSGSISGAAAVTHSLFLQVVSHLLVLVLRQLLVSVLIVLGKDGLDLSVRVALSGQTERERFRHKLTVTVGSRFQYPVKVRSPFKVLTKLVKVQFASCLTQTVRDVVYRRLLQPQLHQSFVTALEERRD